MVTSEWVVLTRDVCLVMFGCSWFGILHLFGGWSSNSPTNIRWSSLSLCARSRWGKYDWSRLTNERTFCYEQKRRSVSLSRGSVTDEWLLDARWRRKYPYKHVHVNCWKCFGHCDNSHPSNYSFPSHSHKEPIKYTSVSWSSSRYMTLQIDLPTWVSQNMHTYTQTIPVKRRPTLSTHCTAYRQASIP